MSIGLLEVKCDGEYEDSRGKHGCQANTSVAINVQSTQSTSRQIKDGLRDKGWYADAKNETHFCPQCRSQRAKRLEAI
jgi:hypothetical protein